MIEKENGRNIYPIFLLMLVFVILILLVKMPDEEESIQESKAVPTVIRPTHESPPTSSLPGYRPFMLANVTCRDGFNDVQDFDHWSDALIPGISTIDDLLALRDIPEKFQPERTGYDSISTGGAALWFSNGILESKSDPRTKLGEILAHYGPPDKVLWQLPSYDNDHPVEDTILLYPEHNGFFYGRDKVITFSPNSEFHSLFFSSQEDYLLYTSVNFETDRFELFIESAWPCDD